MQIGHFYIVCPTNKCNCKKVKKAANSFKNIPFWTKKKKKGGNMSLNFHGKKINSLNILISPKMIIRNASL